MHDNFHFHQNHYACLLPIVHIVNIRQLWCAMAIFLYSAGINSLVDSWGNAFGPKEITCFVFMKTKTPMILKKKNAVSSQDTHLRHKFI